MHIIRLMLCLCAAIAVVAEAGPYGPFGPDEDYAIDMTAGVQQLLDGPWTSFVIRLDIEDGYRRLYFASRERSVVDERPVLDVCYTAD